MAVLKATSNLLYSMNHTANYFKNVNAEMGQLEDCLEMKDAFYLSQMRYKNVFFVS